MNDVKDMDLVFREFEGGWRWRLLPAGEDHDKAPDTMFRGMALRDLDCEMARKLVASACTVIEQDLDWRKDNTEPSYAAMTREEEGDTLELLVRQMSVDEMLTIGDIHSILREHLNNDLLDQWAKDHPDKAYRAPEPAQEEPTINRNVLEMLLLCGMTMPDGRTLEVVPSEDREELRIGNMFDITLEELRGVRVFKGLATVRTWYGSVDFLWPSTLGKGDDA